MKRALMILVATVITVFSGAAQATVITFDDMEQAGTDALRLLADYSSNGFTFASSDSIGFTAWQQGNVNYDTSAALFNDIANATTTLTLDGGGLFSIDSIDLDLLFVSGTATVNFFAYDAGNSVVGNLSVDLVTDGWQTVNFSSDFSGIAYLQWDQTPDYHQFDNVNVAAAVPEPASMTLLSLGMAGIAYRRRKRA